MACICATVLIFLMAQQNAFVVCWVPQMQEKILLNTLTYSLSAEMESPICKGKVGLEGDEKIWHQVVDRKGASSIALCVHQKYFQNFPSDT